MNTIERMGEMGMVKRWLEVRRSEMTTATELMEMCGGEGRSDLKTAGVWLRKLRDRILPMGEGVEVRITGEYDPETRKNYWWVDVVDEKDPSLAKKAGEPVGWPAWVETKMELEVRNERFRELARGMRMSRSEIADILRVSDSMMAAYMLPETSRANRRPSLDVMSRMEALAAAEAAGGDEGFKAVARRAGSFKGEHPMLERIDRVEASLVSIHEKLDRLLELLKP